jgi:hypothetical protein
MGNIVPFACKIQPSTVSDERQLARSGCWHVVARQIFEGLNHYSPQGTFSYMGYCSYTVS